MNRFLVPAIALGTAIGIGATFVPETAHAAPASFIQTCSEVAISSSTSSGATITANCAKANGVKIPASIRLKYVTNINGVLTYNPEDKDGSFAQSCSAVKFDPATAALSARCKDARGILKPATSLVIENIGNYNGVLKYDGE